MQDTWPEGCSPLEAVTVEPAATGPLPGDGHSQQCALQEPWGC